MSTAIRDILQRVGSLPPLPDTAIRLMNVINDPRSTVDEIVEVIRYDQAVTAEVLKLCNSAYFGMTRTITSLSEAMVCLGTVKVLQLVMSVHTSALLSKAQIGYGLAPGMLWRHSVAVALAASATAQRINLGNVSLAFTAGLLHDIGKVVLNEYVAEEFLEIVRRVREEKLAFVEAEQAVLGYSHEEIGGRIADVWKLPQPIIQSIRHHHDPTRLVPPDPFVDTVYLANCICLLLGIGLGEDGLYSRASDAVMQRNGLKESDLENIGAQMLLDLRKVEQIFEGQSNRSTRPTPGPGVEHTHDS